MRGKGILLLCSRQDDEQGIPAEDGMMLEPPMGPSFP